MRKYYLDNIRWMTVVLVVVYHVIYMYNAEGIPGVVGKITELDVQYYDLYQYIVYPWFMILLFMVSGICSKLYLDTHSEKEFVRSRTRKLLVPGTIGLFAFQFIQGLVNASLSNVLTEPGVPAFVRVIAVILSGSGVLWYIQLLWLFSMVLIPIRKFEGGRLTGICKKTGIIGLLILFIPAYGAAQIMNTPIVVVYRFGYYFFAFILGYFVLSNDEVVDVLKKWFPLFEGLALVTGTAFCIMYFGQNYADNPAYRSVLFVAYGYAASFAVIGGTAKYGDFSNSFTGWMSKRSFGLYVFHYLGISSVGLLLARPGIINAPAAYFLSLTAGFGLAYLLNAVISRIPFFRWAVLGIKKEEKANVQ